MSKDNQNPGYGVIGAGIVGICTALSLLERGREVTLFDRLPPAEATSFGNAGVISSWACVPQSMPGLWKNIPEWLFNPEGPVALRWRYLPEFLPWMMKFFAAGKADRIPAIADAMLELHRPTVDLFHRHLEGTGHEGLIRDSSYVFAYRNAADADLNKYEWRLRTERGVPVQRLDRAALLEIEPEISDAYQAAIVIRDQGRAMDPGKIGKVLAEKFQRMGGTFRQCDVNGLHPQENGTVNIATDQGMFETERVVLAAGVWSANLLKPLGIDVPLESERGYHIVFTNPGITINNSIMMTDAKCVISSMNTGIRCAGTAEFAGLDHPPDYNRAHVLARPAKRLLPNLDTEAREVWMGQRPSFPDSLPAIGEVPGIPGIIAAFGHAHLGLTAAPMTGQLASQLAVGEIPNIDISPYAVDRF